MPPVRICRDSALHSQDPGALQPALWRVGVVLDAAGFLIAGVVLGEVPEDFGVFGIEGVVEVFGVADGDHGNALRVVACQSLRLLLSCALISFASVSVR